MNIGEIDQFIDNELDRFATDIVEKNKPLIKKITESKNMVPYYDNIIGLIKKLTDTIDGTLLQKILNTEQRIAKVVQIIQRYCAYYIFCLIAIRFPQDSEDIFLNNLIELSIVHNSTEYKITDFFNPDNNSIMMKLFTLIKNILYLISLTEAQITSLSTIVKKKYSSAIDFLNEFGKEFITEYLLPTVEDYEHNLIKLIVFNKLFLTQEKEEIGHLLEDMSIDEGEYTMIDIVIAQNNTVSVDELVTTIGPYGIYAAQLLDASTKILSDDDKIDYLFQSSFILPITDEFLRIHDNKYHIEDVVDITTLSQSGQQHQDKKIKSIINAIDDATELYTDNKIFSKYFNKKNNKSVIFNELDELKIIDKLLQASTKDITTDEYLGLVNYRNYAYINFKNKPFGFTYINHDIPYMQKKSIDSVRYVNIELYTDGKDLHKYIETRNIVLDELVNVVGLCIAKSSSINCVHISNLLNIQNISWNLLTDGETILINYFIESGEIIDLNDETQDTYKCMYYLVRYVCSNNPIPSALEKKIGSSNLYCLLKIQDARKFMGKLYDYCSENILASLASVNITSIEDYLCILDNLHNDLLAIKNAPSFENYNKKIRDKIFFSQNITPNVIEKKQLIIPKQRIKLNACTQSKQDNYHTIGIDFNNYFNLKPYIVHKTYKRQIEANITAKSVCQHHLQWRNLKRMKITDEVSLTIFNQAISAFSDKFLLNDMNGFYTCNICNETVEIGNYLKDANYDSSTHQYYFTYVPMNIDLHQLTEYRGIPKIITKLYSLIDKLYSITGVKQSSDEDDAKTNRTRIVRLTIDLLRKIESLNDEWVSHAKDVNTLISYIVWIFLVGINDVQISRMTFDKFSNIESYRKYGVKIFSELKINNIALDSLPVLTYIIYNISYLLYKYKIWIIVDKKQFAVLQREIIHELHGALVKILSINIVNDFTQKFYRSMDTVYRNPDLLEIIAKEQIRREKNISQELVKTFAIPPFTTVFPMVSISNKKLSNGTYFPVPREDSNYYKIDLHTNCPTGEFHKYPSQSDIKEKKATSPIQCMICGTVSGSVKDSNNNGLDEKYKAYTCNKYKCKDDTIKESERKNTFLKEDIDAKKEAEHQNNLQTMYRALEQRYGVGKNIIDQFLSTIEKLVGYDTNLGSNTAPHYLKKNTVIINHNYMGVSIDPLFIAEDKILLEPKNEFFATEVLYYNDIKNNVIVYYDALSHKLLGYRKKGKEYNKDVKSNVYLIINYSTDYKIKHFGYDNHYLFIDDAHTCSNYLEKRVDVIKKIIYFFVQTLYRIKNYNNIRYNYKIPEYKSNRIRFESIIHEYGPLLSKIKLNDCFTTWPYLEELITPTVVKSILTGRIINEQLTDIDDSGNMLIYYLLTELIKVIDGNTNLQKSIINLLLIMIDYIHQIYNHDKDITNLGWKRFQHILQATEFTVDTERKGLSLIDDNVIETVGIYEEVVTEEEMNSKAYKEKLETDKERADALDIDDAMNRDDYQDDDEFFENDLVNEYDGAD